MQNFLFSLHCLSTTFTQSCLSAVVNCLALCWAEIHMLCLLQLAAVPHDRNEVIVKLIWGSKAFRMLGGVNKMIFSLGGVVRYFFWKVYYLQSLSLMLISHHFSSAFIREVLSADCSSCHSLHNVFFLGFFPLRVFVFLMDLHCKTFFLCFMKTCVLCPTESGGWLGLQNQLEGCTFARANGSQPVYLKAGIWVVPAKELALNL